MVLSVEIACGQKNNSSANKKVKKALAESTDPTISSLSTYEIRQQDSINQIVKTQNTIRQQRLLDSIVYNKNGLAISYATFRDNCIVMSLLGNDHAYKMRGRSHYDDYYDFRIPAGIPLYCPKVYKGKKCNIYVLRYEKVYQFGEPFKARSPDTMYCLYENGLLKSIKGDVNSVPVIYIFKYDEQHRITNLTCYTNYGIYWEGRSISYGSSYIIYKGAAGEKTAYNNDSCRLEWCKDDDNLFLRFREKEDSDKYGKYAIFTDYFFNSDKVTIDRYRKYRYLEEYLYKYITPFIITYHVRDKRNPRNTKTHYYDFRDEKISSYYFTPLCAYQPDDRNYIFEYEIHE